MKSRLFPAQLALPLDCSASVPAARPQSPEPSKRPRSRFLQARLETNLAMLARLDTVPGSFHENSDINYFRQGQRFKLTPSLSTLITEVNGKRWSHVAALPSFGKGEVAKFSEGRPFVGRGSPRNLQIGPLGRTLTASLFARAAIVSPSTPTRPASCSSARPASTNSASRPARSSPAARCRSATTSWPSRSS